MSDDFLAPDLAYAKELYEQSMSSGEAIDEVWESGGAFDWRLTTWQDVVPTPTMGDPSDEAVGVWNVSLEMRGGPNRLVFVWTGDRFAAV